MFKRNTHKFHLSTLSVAVMGLLSTGAIAQQSNAAQEEDVEQIIVTATKRAESIGDIPFSINAQTQKRS